MCEVAGPIKRIRVGPLFESLIFRYVVYEVVAVYCCIVVVVTTNLFPVEEDQLDAHLWPI